MDKKPTKVQTALQFAGCVECICGEKMELHERENRMEMETEFYFLCPACGKWTCVEKIHSNLPLADIMERIQRMAKRMQAVHGGAKDGDQP